MEWFDEWFDEYYLELYAKRDPHDAENQANLIIRKLGNTLTDNSGQWLDVGCGAGRYTAIFKKRGYPITGIDISRVLIEEGKKRYPDLDIRFTRIETLLKQALRFQVILSLFTSFGYYEDDRDNVAFLQTMGELAEPKGHLWLDFLNADKIFQDPLTDTVFRGQSGRTFLQRRRIRSRNREKRIEKEIEVYDQHSRFIKSYRESVRLYTLNDLVSFLSPMGFSVREVLGDYRGGAFSSTSPRLIIWAQKNYT